ncbi:MAG: hypothetical protein ACE14W_12820 [Candidatus Velamenicoccus archaeovorus]
MGRVVRLVRASGPVLAAGLLIGGSGPAVAEGRPMAVLDEVIATSAWSPASPDPSGLASSRATGRILVSDGEVDETDLFRGSNVFDMREGGRLKGSFGLTRFTNEPAGIALRPGALGTMFVVDDQAARIFIVRWGHDGRWGTKDDRARSFRTRTLGCADAEGLAFGRRSLFVACGTTDEIVRVRPGRDGRFDGAAPDGDDRVTSFDTTELGLTDVEAVEYDAWTGHLLIAAKQGRAISEVTLGGRPVYDIDISMSGISHPAGITLVRSDSDPATAKVYVADRGVDNGSDPDENDGRIFVFTVTWP